MGPFLRAELPARAYVVIYYPIQNRNEREEDKPNTNTLSSPARGLRRARKRQTLYQYYHQRRSAICGGGPSRAGSKNLLRAVGRAFTRWARCALPCHSSQQFFRTVKESSPKCTPHVTHRMSVFFLPTLFLLLILHSAHRVSLGLFFWIWFFSLIRESIPFSEWNQFSLWHWRACACCTKFTFITCFLWVICARYGPPTTSRCRWLTHFGCEIVRHKSSIFIYTQFWVRRIKYTAVNGLVEIEFDSTSKRSWNYEYRLFEFIHQFVLTFCNLPQNISKKFEENDSKSLLYCVTNEPLSFQPLKMNLDKTVSDQQTAYE